MHTTPRPDDAPTSVRCPELVCSPKRVRVWLGGCCIADSRRVMLLREPGRSPVYYFPESAIRASVLQASPLTRHCPRKGRISYRHVACGETRRENAAWNCPEVCRDGISLSGHIAFDWDAMDAWYEEDEQVFVHARDPFTRIDVLQGSRHVQVMHRGVRIADSRRPVLLFETGLPTRFYLPGPDVRLDLLIPSDTLTRCPYKGEARYYSMRAGGTVAPDLFWTYPCPAAEVAKIAGLLAFAGEQVDQLRVDGEPQSAPGVPGPD
jgi:uncharacterized protein (DUF427 family)